MEKTSQPNRLKRALQWLVLIVVAVGLGLAVSLTPLPFVIYSPGPTFDVLGDQDGQPLIEIRGSDEPAEGELRMVTVSEEGGPGTTVTAPMLLRAWRTPGYSISRYSDVYPDDVTSEDMEAVSSAQMESSHSTAAVAALEYLGYRLPTVITVVGIAEDSGAAGKIEVGDQLVSIETPDGTVYPMKSPSAPFRLLRDVPAGTELQVTVERGGRDRTESVITTEDPADPEQGSKLGVVLSFDIDMPVEINFHLENVGGPSAGMMFALGIIDKINGGTLVGGNVIAGTGAMHYDGTVEPIGGIEQKMYGAFRDGAEWFLAPTSNCDEVPGNYPDGLEVRAVGTLSEAVDAVQKIAAGRGDEVPTCESVVG